MSNQTYVFNQSTLEHAIDIWVAQQQINHPQDKEALTIFKIAIPWFMKHLNQTNSVYMFSQKLLIDELDQWKKIQLSSFPQQSTRIGKTCKLIIDFFKSEVVLNNKMLIE